MTASTARYQPGYRVPKACENCDTLFEILPSRDRLGEGRFCSAACARQPGGDPMTTAQPPWLRARGERADQATAAWEQHQGEIAARGAVRTVRVPNRHIRVRFTGQCPFCAATAFSLDLPTVGVDRPHVSARGDVLCLLCGRAVLHLQIGGAP